MTDTQDQTGNKQTGNDQTRGSILDGGGIDVDARAGRSLGIEVDKVPDEQTRQLLDEERSRRLDPANRPQDAEIDNTQRTFDHERGQFIDGEGYDASAPARFSDPEDPNNAD
jgi:hypothetical protein